MNDFDPTLLLMRVAQDFLVRGQDEPVAFHPSAAGAIAEAIELADGLGALQPGLNDLLLFAYDLEGSGDSPYAAQALRGIVARSAVARASLGIEDDRGGAESLKKRGKQLARDRGDARARDAGTVRAGDFQRRRMS